MGMILCVLNVIYILPHDFENLFHIHIDDQTPILFHVFQKSLKNPDIFAKLSCTKNERSSHTDVIALLASYFAPSMME